MTPNDDQLRIWYEQLLRIRCIEEAIADRYSQQEMRCPTHLSIGQEAVAVGVSSALSPTDLVLSNHRSHAHYLAKGGNPRNMLAEIHGRATGCCAGRGGSMHLTDLKAGFIGAVPIVAATISMAVGVAMAERLQGRDGVVVTYFGEAATEEGSFFESLNFARLHNLPVLFVCEDNLYSVYSPVGVRQPSDRDLRTIVQGHGLPVATCDGNDVEAVAAAANTLVANIRRGQGPALLLASTYRWREHCGPNFDNDIGYRSPKEFQNWKDRCPVALVESRLGLDSKRTRQARAALREWADGLIDAVREDPWPDASKPSWNAGIELGAKV